MRKYGSAHDHKSGPLFWKTIIHRGFQIKALGRILTSSRFISSYSYLLLVYC